MPKEWLRKSQRMMGQDSEKETLRQANKRRAGMHVDVGGVRARHYGVLGRSIGRKIVIYLLLQVFNL